MYFPFLTDCGTVIQWEQRKMQMKLVWNHFDLNFIVSNSIEMNINFIKHKFERLKTEYISLNQMLKHLHWLSKILGLVKNTKRNAGFMQRKWLDSHFWYFKSKWFLIAWHLNIYSQTFNPWRREKFKQFWIYFHRRQCSCTSN